ncbi:hypothetical protein [Cellulomonas sp. Leaf395]|uniref:hypothetical protein n=1 Tax=Cellulomonas sp. Leaf395 TaxID=1736362 RepID=UPI000701B7FF|nr:hypothetical protein [Cellulomonas sp. Leaf395]KQT02087.1 hypothetical protein ASG23_01625 [Cellulomonas sp. Leaf395]
MSDTGRPGPERPAGPPTPPISSWDSTQPKPPTAPISTTPPAEPAAGPRAGIPAAFAAQQATPAAATEPDPESTASAASGRPRWLIPAIIGVAVLVIAAIIVGIVRSSGDDTEDATPAVATTILLPSPTPTVEAAARPATTAFAVALPPTVLQYALATSVPDTEWQAAGAIEAYTETYTDGGDGTVTVRSGQWETPEEATAFAATLVAAFPAAPATPDPSASPTGPTLPQSGDVTAGGAVAGTYSIADAGDGTGVAVWVNGTTVFQATAPVADIVDVYNAFPL